MIQQDVAREVAVRVAQGRVLERARLDVDVVDSLLQLGPVLLLQVPRAVLARVLPVHIAVIEVVIA